MENSMRTISSVSRTITEGRKLFRFYDEKENSKVEENNNSPGAEESSCAESEAPHNKETSSTACGESRGRHLPYMEEKQKGNGRARPTRGWSISRPQTGSEMGIRQDARHRSAWGGF